MKAELTQTLLHPHSHPAALQPPAASPVWQELRDTIKGVSLDLWGTILDDAQAPADTVVYSSQRQNFLLQELRRHGQERTAEELRAAYRHAWEHFDALWEKQIAFDASDGIRAMLSHLHADLPPESFAAVQEFFEHFRQPPLPLAGVVPAVQALAQRYVLALISDTAWTPGRVLRQILGQYEILDCFRVLVFSGEVGYTKPHPEMFRRALAGLQVAPGQCLHVGDLQRTDIAGARALGVRAAWIYRPVYTGKPQEDHHPDVVVPSVAHLARMLLGE